MRVAVNGVQLFFDADGAKWRPEGKTLSEVPTILMLHGGPGSDHANFKPFLLDLPARAQVIYLDHRGNGRSDVSTPEHWTLKQWADDVASFMDVLGIEKPIVLGASFGGFVAQAFATAYPERLSKLALLCTAPRGDVELSVKQFTKLGGAKIGEIARQFLTQTDANPEVEAAYMQQCVPHYSVEPYDLELLGRSIERAEPRRHFFRRGGEFHTMDFRPGLKRIQCPTLVLNGAHDPILPMPLPLEIHDAIPRGLSRQHVVRNAGHSWMDNAEEWRAVLHDFLFET